MNFKFEPVRFFAALDALVAFLINGLVTFDQWSPSAEQLGYANGAVAAVAAFVLAVFIRAQVTPNAAVEGQVHDTIVALSNLEEKKMPDREGEQWQAAIQEIMERDGIGEIEANTNLSNLLRSYAEDPEGTAIYVWDTVINILSERDGISKEEASENFINLLKNLGLLT